MEINFSVTKPATTVEQCQVKSRKVAVLVQSHAESMKKIMGSL